MASVCLSLLIGTFVVVFVILLVAGPLFHTIKRMLVHKGPWLIVPWNPELHLDREDFNFGELQSRSLYTIEFDPANNYRSPFRLAAADGSAGIYIVPIRYSEEDSGFVVPAQVGSTVMDLVLDSGSSNVSVASADCVASNQCGDVSIGYDPEKSEAAVDLKTEDTLNYASLEVKAKKFLDTLVFFAASDGLELLCAKRSHRKSDDTIKLQLTDTLVASATSMDGTHSNIIGLMQGSGFLDHMFSQTGMRPQWGIVCNQRSPWFVIGSIEEIDCVPKKNILWMPMSKRFRYMGAYVLDVEEIMLNGEPMNPKDGPLHVIVDTGTAESYWSPASCMGAWSPSLIDEKGQYPTIEYQFKTADGLGWRMTMSPDHYMVHGRSNLHGTNSNVARLFPTERVMILGIAHMMGLYWHFDLEGNRVGVCPWA